MANRGGGVSSRRGLVRIPLQRRYRTTDVVQGTWSEVPFPLPMGRVTPPSPLGCCLMADGEY